MSGVDFDRVKGRASHTAGLLRRVIANPSFASIRDRTSVEEKKTTLERRSGNRYPSPTGAMETT
jgi:hypothetical protein